MKGKIFTLEEAILTLPYVRPIAEDIERTYSVIKTHTDAHGEAHHTLERPGSMSAELRKRLEVEIEQAKSLLNPALDRLQELVTDLEKVGIIVSDYGNADVAVAPVSSAVLQWYGEVAGEIIYFVWDTSQATIVDMCTLQSGRRFEVSSFSPAPLGPGSDF